MRSGEGESETIGVSPRITRIGANVGGRTGVRGRKGERDGSFEFKFRVEPDLDDIDHEIQDDDERRVEDDGAEDQGVIAVEGAVDEFAAEAGDLENGLDHE